MARQIVVTCDVHGDKGEDVPGSPVLVGLYAREPRQIDLCSDCEAQYVAPLLAVVDAHGVQVQVGAAARSSAASSRKVSHVCPMCWAEFGSDSGISRHCRQAHDRSLAEVYGTTCPLCGQTFARVAMHLARAHPEVKTQAEAWLTAREMGDPHGAISQAAETH